jgi:ABC-type transport system involved in multi-copper enzyme maturation permease subunit
MENSAPESSDRPLASLRSSLTARLADLVVDNPIFLRELRRRMRGKALFTAIIGYIAVMAIVAFIVVLIHTVEMRRSDAVNIMPVMRAMSDNLFTWIAVIQGVLVLFVGPIITAGIATAEKERRTLDFLQVTTLRPWHFVFGALASTMLYILLVLLCALPILSITFLFGGVAPSDIAASLGSLLLMSTILSAGALYIACMRERSRSAQSALLFVVGIIFLNIILFRILTRRMFFSGGGGMALLPFSAMAPGGEINLFGWPVPSWWGDIGASLLLIALLSLLAGRRIFNPENRALSYWQGLLFFALAELALAAQFWGARLASPTDIPLVGIATWILLVLAVFIYNTGRVEMGNEVWRLKRRFAFLRPVDESVLQILALLGIWWVIGGWWVEGTAAARTDRVGALVQWHATFGFVGATTLFTCALARVFAHRCPTRGVSLRWTFLTVIGLFWALPLLVIFTIMMARQPHAVGDLNLRLTLLGHTPWIYLSELAGEGIIREMGRFDFSRHVADSATLAYGVLAAALFALAWLFSRRQVLRPDYGLDSTVERRISEVPYLRPDIFTSLRPGSGEET